MHAIHLRVFRWCHHNFECLRRPINYWACPLSARILPTDGKYKYKAIESPRVAGNLFYSILFEWIHLRLIRSRQDRESLRRLCSIECVCRSLQGRDVCANTCFEQDQQSCQSLAVHLPLSRILHRDADPPKSMSICWHQPLVRNE